MIRVEIKVLQRPPQRIVRLLRYRYLSNQDVKSKYQRIHDEHSRSNIIVLLFFRYFTVISIATSSHSSWTSYLGTKFPLGQALSCWACHLLPLTSTICISWVYVVALECTLSSSGYSMLSLG